MRNLKLVILYIFVSGIFFSCKNQMKFNKTDWLEKGDLNSFPKRDKMLEDLLLNYPLKGISYSKLVDLLGTPEIDYYSESNQIYYSIITEYSSDIDPVSTKILQIELNEDSVVRQIKILTFKK